MTSRFLIGAFIMTAVLSAQAASVSQVKGNKVLIQDVGVDELHAGDELYAVTSEGKKRAVLKVTQVKGKKAIAEITKGNPEAGLDIQIKSSAGAMSRDVRDSDLGTNERSSDDSAYYKRLRKKFSGAAWGVEGEMLMMNMSATTSSGTGNFLRTSTASMSGNTFGLMGFYDYPMAPGFQIRGYGGLQQVQATGTIDNPDCGKTTSCIFKVTYLSLYGAAKYNFYDKGGLRWFGEAGYGFLMAMTKDSNIVSPDGIVTNQVFFLGGGAEIPLSGNSFIPISLDYGMFPPSDTVKANMWILRAGYAWPL